MTRIQRDTVISAAIVLTCLGFLVWVIPAYTPPYPGYGASPALVPNVAVGVMLVMALLALLRNVLVIGWGRQIAVEEGEYPGEGGSQGSGFTQVGRVNLLHLLRFMIPCGLLVPAMGWIGFVPTGLVFMLVIQFIVGRRKPVPAILVAATTVAVIYAAMRYGFNVPIPGA